MSAARPANTMGFKLLYSKFEICFSRSTKDAGSKTHLESRFYAIEKNKRKGCVCVLYNVIYWPVSHESWKRQVACSRWYPACISAFTAWGNQSYTERGLKFFITESGFDACFGWHRWDPAPKVPGAKHISNPDIAPF